MCVRLCMIVLIGWVGGMLTAFEPPAGVTPLPPRSVTPLPPGIRPLPMGSRTPLPLLSPEELEIAKQLGAPFARSRSKKPSLPTVGHTITPEMGFWEALECVYLRELDVLNIMVGFRFFDVVRDMHPSQMTLIEGCFDQRIEARSIDKLLSPQWDQDNEQSKQKVIAELKKREANRTRQLCDSLQELLTPDEVDELCSKLFKIFSYRALGFPLVADELGIDRTGCEQVNQSYDRGFELMTKQARSGTSVYDLKYPVSLIVSGVDFLTVSQVERIHRYRGELTEEMDIDSLVECVTPDMKQVTEKVVQMAKKNSLALEKRER